MREPITELQPYEPADDSYDWDYENEGRGAPKILWGRVIALAVAMLLAFFIGRSTSGADSATDEQLRAANAEVKEAKDAQATAEARADELVQANKKLVKDNLRLSAGATDTDETSDPTSEGDGITYTVKSGDTLLELANEYCGDTTSTQTEAIKDANSDVDWDARGKKEKLLVGEKLFIPDSCKV